MVAILAPLAASSQVTETVVRDWLVIEAIDVAGRRPFRCDAVFAKHLLDRDSAPPRAGEELTGERGKPAAWRKSEAATSGAVEGGIAWAYTKVESPEDRVALAQLSGASTLYVNGAPFAGDLYGYGFRGVPVALRKGANDVYVTGMRGGFSLKLRAPSGPLVVADWDATFPDARAGQASVLVLNASDRPLELAKPARRKFLPLEAAKVPIPFDVGSDEVGKHRFLVSAEGSGASASASFDVEIRSPRDAARHVFTSRIDGSVQPFAVLPPSSSTIPDRGWRLVLTLHGAGVDALGQARSYSAKPEYWIVAPTNRRPYGFDWQDWGRLDAYEVLDLALDLSGADPNRVYLTGHSMGGHGTWHLAVNDPGRFGVIAPSAGWISFDTYPGRPKGPLADLWQGADAASRTLDLLPNLARTSVYILHGSADDNVPVAEARTIEKALRESNEALGSRYTVVLDVKEGAGHWWDGAASPGVDCVDWPPIFELFDTRSGGPRRNRFEWSTVDPCVTSSNEWIEIAQPLEYGKPLRVRADMGWETRRHNDGWVEVTTENVRRLRLHLSAEETSARVSIDSLVPRSRSGWYLREKDRWVPDESGPPESEKSPTRSGPFKRAFDERFVLVYGTSGDERENRELVELARWSSESWWYRGNGSTEVLSDREFLARPAAYSTRNVILFGNADTNAAWKAVVPERCPLAAKRGALRLGEKSFEGAGLAALCVYPRAEGRALVGLCADTGPRGTRLLGTIPVFISGVGIPDYAIFGPDVLTRGDGGVLAAGWFDFAWRL